MLIRAPLRGVVVRDLDLVLRCPIRDLLSHRVRTSRDPVVPEADTEFARRAGGADVNQWQRRGGANLNGAAASHLFFYHVHALPVATMYSWSLSICPLFPNFPAEHILRGSSGRLGLGARHKITVTSLTCYRSVTRRIFMPCDKNSFTGEV